MSINSILDEKEYNLLSTTLTTLKVQYPTSEDAQEWLTSINYAIDSIVNTSKQMKKEFNDNMTIDLIKLNSLLAQKQILRNVQEKIMKVILAENKKIQALFDELDRL